MLTLCRLAPLQTLNYSKVSAQDRGDAELYYLSLIGKELSASPSTAEWRILAAHPRYGELCEKYGEPTVKRSADSAGPGDAAHPRSVATRLVRMVFYLSPAKEVSRTKEIPQSFNTYQVKAVVSRLFGLPPLSFSLIWETDELDPVNTTAGDQWDSSEDEEGDMQVDRAGFSGFVKREVELVDSTRDLTLWFPSDLHEARIRVQNMDISA